MDDISAFFAAADIKETDELREAFQRAVLAALQSDTVAVARATNAGNVTLNRMGIS